MHRKPTTKSHITEEEEEQRRAKKKKPKPKNGDSTQNNETTAKYKLMSPAKLPISRSTCLTIPFGLSPTLFLESPVLLSNVKIWSCSLSLMPHKKSKGKKNEGFGLIGDPNHKLGLESLNWRPKSRN